MKTSRDKLIDEIYSGALDRTNQERETYVEDACGNDAALKEEVLALIESSGKSEQVLESRMKEIRDRLLHSLLGDHSDSGEDLSGRSINNWRLVKRIARGGLATVYFARRDDGAFDQKAAFKVLRRGLDTDDLIARFRVERQILSTLDHPSIAQILDGGALEDGRPYLVLEYVDGQPITEYCNDRQLSVRDKVVLMLDVLRALHHAHTHLVVHRDVKPSNILVTPDNNVSLLDFGIAKLLNPEAIPFASTMTRTGVSLLTPGYGSPEQHAGEAVTTASDIYQCGLVLFEMLTGRRPFDEESMPGQTVELVPSLQLRGRSAFREVRGDLDAIVRKATHGDPERRYASADKMVTDLERYLDGLPVAAQPDSFGYRVSKLARRRPWLLPALGVFVLGVGAYVSTLTLYNKQLQVEQRRATAAQDFIINLFRSADPFEPADQERGRDITVVEALDIGMERLQSGQYDDPSLKESLLESVADVYASLDRHDRVIELRHELLALQRDLYQNESEAVIQTLQTLASQYRTIGDYETARKYYDEQLEVARAVYSPTDPMLGVAEAVSGRFLHSWGDWVMAEQLFESGIEKMRRDTECCARHFIDAIVKLADVKGDRDREETLRMLGEAQQFANRTFGSDSPMSTLVIAQTASSLAAYGEFESAEGGLLQAISRYESMFGRDHGETLAVLLRLGALYEKMLRFDRAEIVYEETSERFLEKYGPGHRGVANSHAYLASALSLQGRYEASIPHYRKAIESYRAVFSEDNPITGEPVLGIAHAELSLGNAEQSEAAATEALGWFQMTDPGGSREGAARCLLGWSLEAQGRLDKGKILVAQGRELIGGEEARGLTRRDAITHHIATRCRVTD